MRCRWSAFALAVLFAGVSVACAQPPIEAKDGKYLVPLAVQPVAPPKPALKYRLLPELRERQPGNQIQAFYKCFMEQHYLFHNKESTDKQKKWMEAPLKDLKDVKDLVGYGGGAYRHAAYAARLDTVDWEITSQAKTEGVGLLLPDIQEMRSLAAILKIRIRGEIARGEFDKAIQSLQTLFGLARTFNEHPTLIGSLVGMAINGIALEAVEEFIQQPEAPNLFWAIAHLPSPFIDLRKGREGERLFVPVEYEVLMKAKLIPEAELNALVKKLDSYMDPDDAKKHLLPTVWFPKQAADKAAVAAARERLAGFGHKPADLEKLSALQIVLTDDLTQYEVNLDEFVKWSNVPFWQVPPDLATAKRGDGPFSDFLPAMYKVMSAKLRVQQWASLLMVAEGLRAHAADNGGKLPAALDQVKLPLPVDPVTGKPFAYEVKEGKAVLRGTPPAGQEKNASYNRVYEITIRK